ncbi:hypothetical protein OQX63_17680 [Pedobacter sp. PF22-3]|uniref:hypothetical protein n=1 Tax=Pedobacter sp. PF22-3 TaxID=2994467 RepID=UPI002247AA7B|nr:hypothetical protein [Pedobacter sp. PF22-3]MCX2495326.1 hypothetical protein [Pedobacter sp. PF22-3]
MKTIKIRTDESVSQVPLLIPFQGAPKDQFDHHERVLIQLVNDDGDLVGEPEIRAVVKTHDGDENNSAWYEAFVPKETD